MAASIDDVIDLPPLVPRSARGWEIDESARAEAIAAHDVESLRDTAGLKRITDFAAALCDTPVALVSLVEERRQTFIARTGLEMTETPRDLSFCAFAMMEDDIMVVPDASHDVRFADNPLVMADSGVRFYAGAPLVSDDGVPLGSLCVIDIVPRAGLTALQRQGLTTLADAVMARLRDSRDAIAWRTRENATHRALAESHNRFRVLADAMPQMVWSTRPDGYADYYNARWYEFTGMPQGATGEQSDDLFHPEDRDRVLTAWRASLVTGEPYQAEYRLRSADGGHRWVLARALPLRDDSGAITRWFGTCTDVDEQKQASDQREVISQELSHRIKNIFAVIAALVGFAARGRPEFANAASDLRQRITALGRAHDYVRPRGAVAQPTARNDLGGLLDDLFEPYQRYDGARIVVSGADLAIDDRAATPIALLFHELATNATKYGGLSVEGGSVTLDVTHEGDAAIFQWRERGGPAIAAAPDATGFGSQLIEMSAVRQLGGDVTRNWRPEGLAVTITFPIAALGR